MSENLYLSSLADIRDIESVPLAQRDLPGSTFEMLQAGAAKDPDASALSFILDAEHYKDVWSCTHRELMAHVTKAANCFRRLGVEREDVVAFLLPNLPETYFTIWGGEAAGIVLALNPLLERDALAELMKAGQAKWLVTLGPTPGSDLWDTAVWAASKVGTLEGILQVSVAPYLSGVKGAVMKAHDGLQSLRSHGLYMPVHRWQKEMSKVQGEKLEFDLPGPEDVSSYFCTGGTTGLPKIAARKHSNEVYNAWAINQVVSGAFRPHNAVFCGLPLFHVNGQIVTGLSPWSEGAHVVLGTPQGYRGKGVLDNYWAIAEHFKLVAFSGVPTVYAALVERPSKGYDLSSLEFAICGAAPMPVALFQRFEKEIGLRLLEGYGLTEGACVSSVNPPGGESRTGSIGFRLPYQQMKIVVLDDQEQYERDAQTDEIGTVVILGPNVFKGYLSAHHNKKAWLDIEGQQWLNTGDLGRQDAEGYFWLTGRKKELIIRGGHNIDPKIIEEVLVAHPDVALAAAVGRPDPRLGEVPAVYVELAGGKSSSEQELLDYALEHVAEKSARPQRVRILEALPLTPVGKIFKPDLLRAEIKDVILEVAMEMGVDLESIEVVPDQTLGNLAKVSVSGESAELKDALDRYTFHVQFES
jgi:fatty-acyl-CoA synthase